MSKNPGFAQGIEIAAMKNKTGAPLDLMRPGNGTPWEDRGSTGAVGAYFKTVIKSLFSPALLMDHIRRPETTTDSSVFAIISAVMWVLGVVIYNVYWLYFVLPKGATPYETGVDSIGNYWLTTFIQAILVGGGIFAWLKVAPKIFRSLGATELKNAQPSLISNCFNYAMGPSILALIPFYGWGLAVLWILFDVIAAGKRRLYMRFSSAFINVVMLGGIALAIGAVAYVFVHYIWSGSLIGMSGLTLKPEPKKIVLPG